MKNPTIVAALLSAIVAAVVSMTTTYWTGQSERERTAMNIQLERDKAAIAAQRDAIQQLISARLQHYWGAYELISQLNKDAQAGGVDLDYLERLRSKFDAWDSKHAYLLGPITTNLANEFRAQLSATIHSSQQANLNQDELNKLVDKLVGHIEPLELGLRGDLGVYGLEVHGQEIKTPTVRDYFVEKDE